MMKQFIFAWSVVILCVIGMCYRQDSNLYLIKIDRLKFVCEESAAAGCQYFDLNEFKNGKFVFNQVESIKAIEYTIKTNLKLDDDFMPLDKSYWKDKIKYEVIFLDDSNTIYPYLYENPDGLLNQTITSPTIIVKIDCGKPLFRNISNPPNTYRIAAHSWKGR